MPKIKEKTYTEEEVEKLIKKAFISAAVYSGTIGYYGSSPSEYAKEWFNSKKK